MSSTTKLSGKFIVQVSQVTHIENPTAEEKSERDYWAFVIVAERANAEDGPVFKQEKIRRFNAFREFDMGWRAMYPTLHEKHHLPKAGVSMKSKEQIARERQPQLEAYLQGLAELPLMWPSLANFLGVPLKTIDPNTKAIDVSKVKNIATSSVGGGHGNNTTAQLQAAKDRAEFLKKNQDAINSILAGENFQLPKKRANWAQKIQNRKHYWDSHSNLNIGQGHDNLYRVNIKWEPNCDPELKEDHCIPIAEGDVLELLDNSNEDWWWGVTSEGLEGYFPAACVSEKHDDLESKKKKFYDPAKVNGLEKKMGITIDKFKELATAGQTFTKYAVGVGMPTSKDIFWRKFADSDSEMGCLFYCEVGSRDQSQKRMICLRLIADIFLGKQTTAFQRKVAKTADVSRCFSFLTSDGKNFNFEAKDRETRNNWLWGIYEIMKSKGCKPAFHEELDLSEYTEDLNNELLSTDKSGGKKSFRNVSAKFTKGVKNGLDSAYQAKHKRE